MIENDNTFFESHNSMLLTLLLVNVSLFKADPFNNLFLILVGIYACFFIRKFPFRLAKSVRKTILKYLHVVQVLPVFFNLFKKTGSTGPHANT